MTATFDVKADVREAERGLKGIENGTATAVTRSMNKAIRKAQSTAVKSIAKDVPGIKQKHVRDAMMLKLASRAAWVATVTAKGGRIPVMDLAARQTQRGVTYRTPQGRQLIPSAFIATTKSGHRGVFKRSGKKRLPIQELFGPSIPRVFIQERIERQIDRDARGEWIKELARQIELLNRQAGMK